MLDIAFPIALRGYEREAVDAYVKRVNRLIGELEINRSPDAAVRRALEQVGEETAGILQCAQETASDITARSHASADDCVREAGRAAREMTADAEDRVRELEADYGRIRAERDRLLEELRDLAERLLATADDAAERIPTAGEDEAVAATRADTAWLPALEPRGSSEAGPVIGPEAPAAERSLRDESEPVAVEPTIGQPPDEPTLPDGETDFSAPPDDDVPEGLESDLGGGPPRLDPPDEPKPR